MSELDAIVATIRGRMRKGYPGKSMHSRLMQAKYDVTTLLDIIKRKDAEFDLIVRALANINQAPTPGDDRGR